MAVISPHPSESRSHAGVILAELGTHVLSLVIRKSDKWIFGFLVQGGKTHVKLPKYHGVIKKMSDSHE